MKFKARKIGKNCSARVPSISPPQLTEERIGDALRQFWAHVNEARLRPGWKELAAAFDAVADAGGVVCELAGKSGEVVYGCRLPADQRAAYANLVTHPYPNVLFQLFLEAKLRLRIDHIFGLTFVTKPGFRHTLPAPGVLSDIRDCEREVWRMKAQRAGAEEMLIDVLRLRPERDAAGWPDIRLGGKSLGVAVCEPDAPLFLGSLEEFTTDILVLSSLPPEADQGMSLHGWIERAVFIERHKTIDLARGGGWELPRAELRPITELLSLSRWYAPWNVYE